MDDSAYSLVTEGETGDSDRQPKNKASAGHQLGSDRVDRETSTPSYLKKKVPTKKHCYCKKKKI